MTTTGENSNHHWGYPALIQTADDVWTLISEAGIDRQNSASSLKMNNLLLIIRYVLLRIQSQLLEIGFHHGV